MYIPWIPSIDHRGWLTSFQCHPASSWLPGYMENYYYYDRCWQNNAAFLPKIIMQPLHTQDWVYSPSMHVLSIKYAYKYMCIWLIAIIITYSSIWLDLCTSRAWHHAKACTIGMCSCGMGSFCTGAGLGDCTDQGRKQPYNRSVCTIIGFGKLSL